MNDYRMYAYISEPVEFRQLEGKAIDFRKTFDLRGHGTDEMLQLYLRKANLSDDIERLPPLQRRAYVYDIIRSNKGPGYWVPPSMQVNSDVFAHPPPAVRPPPQVANSIDSNMSSFSSSNSLHSYGGTQAAGTVPGPSFATSVVVSNKGSKYEISGPVNFQHVSGDVTRDRTRNAFDLNAGTNDNVLKKYMMERGITEEDIRGMKRQDVIKKIVHSNFTWMPTKPDLQAKPTIQERPLLYATISTNNQITPPHSPPPVAKPAPSFSNYASLTSRFVDISDMDTPGLAQPASAAHVQQQPQQIQQPKVPPPPSTVTANNTYAYPAAIDPRHVRASAAAPAAKTSSETYATIAPQRKAGTMRVAPPAPPKPTIVPNSNSSMASSVQYAAFAKPTPAPLLVTPTSTISAVPPPPPPMQTPKSIVSRGQVPIGTVPPPPPSMQTPKSTVSRGQVPIPPPPPPASSAMNGMPPPPPPPPAAMGSAPIPSQKSEPPKAAAAAASTGDNRDAFLESIRKGVTLKKVDQKAATISGIKPRAERKPPTTDFLSELKLGITLRRVKNPADNPYSEANADESQA